MSETTMTMQQYHAFTETTAKYPRENEREYLIAGLSGELGELLNAYKKQLRGDGDQRDAMLDELGDVWWYTVRLYVFCRDGAVPHIGALHWRPLEKISSIVLEAQYNLSVLEASNEDPVSIRAVYSSILLLFSHLNTTPADVMARRLNDGKPSRARGRARARNGHGLKPD